MQGTGDPQLQDLYCPPRLVFYFHLAARTERLALNEHLVFGPYCLGTLLFAGQGGGGCYCTSSHGPLCRRSPAQAKHPGCGRATSLSPWDGTAGLVPWAGLPSGGRAWGSVVRRALGDLPKLTPPTFAPSVPPSPQVKYTQVAPKTVQRMLNKLEGDHEKLEPPRPGSNADGCRCGLVIELAHTPGLLAAIAAEFGRNGGGVVRVKNGMALSADEAEAAFGYRAILTNYQCVCEGVTYADVLRHFEAVLAEFGLQESGGPGSRQGELHKVSHWLEEEGRGSQNVTFLTETQAMLPLYAESRKLSHWPYKFLRCQAAGASSSPLQSFMMDLMTLNCD